MKTLAILVSCFVVLSCSTALSATARECGKKDNNNERLVCYDNIFRKQIKWKLDEQTFHANENPTKILILRSNNDVPGRFYGQDKGTVVVRCKDDKTVVMFDAADNIFLDHDKYGRITYSFDQQHATKTISTTASTDSAALGLGSGSQSIPLLKEMMNHDTMTVRLTPYNKETFTMTYDIYGLDEAIKPLRQACGW